MYIPLIYTGLELYNYCLCGCPNKYHVEFLADPVLATARTFQLFWLFMIRNFLSLYHAYLAYFR